LIANLLPIIIPVIIVRAHMITFWVFLSMMLIETSTVHSGYDFWPNLAKKHDRHHEVFIWNFGACIDWFDWLHGTKEVQKSKNAFTENAGKKKN
jgi:sterol desaturase/sphingolipid hydroxylase (fatty acid hydroxylase superfamily)